MFSVRQYVDELLEQAWLNTPPTERDYYIGFGGFQRRVVVLRGGKPVGVKLEDLTPAEVRSKVDLTKFSEQFRAETLELGCWVMSFVEAAEQCPPTLRAVGE